MHAAHGIVSALRRAREEKGLSQRALGGKIGLSQNHISKIENAAVDPQLSNLVELARALDLEVMLVPRRTVPAVQGLVRVQGAAASDAVRPRPAYRLDDGEPDG
jgi:transcriptional regulator with XRE-family HTH domain